MSSPGLVKVEDLSVEFAIGKDMSVQALDQVDFEIPSRGFSMGVVGESGSGKTTLGLALMKLIEPPGRLVSGEISYQGKNVLSMTNKELRNYRWKEVAMVYQSAMNSLNPVKPISHPIYEILRQHESVRRKEAVERTLKLLSEVGIEADRAKDFPHEFSGGMKQRVVIALALALSPKLLIADEPTSALDVVVQQQILKLLKREVTKNELSLIFITHEISILKGLVENIAVMFRGEIVERGPLDKILSSPFHPYTEMLLSTLLTMKSEIKNLDTRQVKDESWSLWSTSKNACKYAGRCKYVFDRCKAEKPELLEVEKGRWVACHKFN
jgi:peptide/nickel transport system ATP-binding protein